MNNFSIAFQDRIIGRGHPTYFIAEMSANHHKDYDRAIEIIQAAKWAGADAIKVQTYTPDTLTINCDKEYFIVSGTRWDKMRLYDLYEKAYMPWDWQPKLQKAAHNIGLQFFSSAYDCTAVDFLEDMNVEAYKIASFENIDIPLLRKIAKTKKPVFISMGMADLPEICEAVSTLRNAGCEQLVLLKCTSAYPSAPEEINLVTIRHLVETFSTPVGLSDHSMGIEIPIAAVAFGASVIEKHFTLSGKDEGPDSAFSLEPEEFKQMVESVRNVEKAVGNIQYGPTQEELVTKRLRRSLFIVRDVKRGEVFTEESVRSIRPGNGIHPRYLDVVIGRRAAKDIDRGTPLDWNLIETASGDS